MPLQGVPAGWKSQEKPGIGRGGVRTAGAAGGYPTAAAYGLIPSVITRNSSGISWTHIIAREVAGEI